MTTAIPGPLAILVPSLDMIIICAFAASLPVLFFVWLRWWLSSVKDENPDDVVREQAKADEAHREHHGHGPGHSGPHGSHGHAPDAGRGHRAHA